MNARFCASAVRLFILFLVAVSPGAFAVIPTGTVQFITDVYGRNENAGDAALTVIRNGDTNTGCSVNWSVTGGSAAAINDYSPTSGTLNFAAGETFKNISLIIVDDALVESNETVNLTLSGAVNATIGFPSNAVLTIFDNDVSNPPPVIQFVASVYGRFEDQTAPLNLERLGDTNVSCSVQWSYTGGTAGPFSDFFGGSSTINFAAGQTIAALPISIVDDAVAESDETAGFSLQSPFNATLGSPSSATLTIYDNDVSNPPPATVVQFITDVYGRNENAGDASLTVTRSGDTSNACSVNWSVTGGSASGGADYSPGSGTLDFAAFETFRNISLLIVDDALVESNETVNLTLSGAVNATIGYPSNAILTIFDNDVSNAPPASADVSMTKYSSTFDPVTVGDQITYTLYAYNAGPDTSTNVIIRDAIPTGAVYVSASGGACTFYPNFQRVDCDVGNLPSGGSAYVYVTVQVTNAGDIVNFANAYGTTPDPNTTNNASGVTNIAVAPQADVSMTKFSSAFGQVTVGDQITYTLYAYNAGPSTSSNVVVRDAIPTGTAYVSASGPGACTFYPNFQRVDCDVGNLPSGASAYVVVTVQVTNAGNVVNFANAYGSTADPNTDNNASGVTNTAVVTGADLAVGKSANVTTVTNGGYIQFYLYATNLGPNAANNVVIREILPPGLQAAGSAVFNGGEHYDSVNGYWYITNMPVGYVTTLNVTAQAIANGTHNNVASLHSSQPADTNSGDNSANVSVTVTNPPGGAAVDLGVSKSVDPTNLVAGGYVQFTLTVTNYGPGTASSIVVQDVMPPGLPFTGAVAATNTFYDAGSGLWFITNLSAGASVALGLSAEATTVGSFVNRAELQSSSPVDTNSANNSADATATVYSRQADLTMTKTVDAMWVLVGEPFTFTITVANFGPDLATGVLVNDMLPPGLVLLDLQPSQGTPIYSAGTVTWDAGYLTVGGSVSLQIKVAAQSEQTFNNIASVTANEPDPVSTNNTSSASVMAAVAPYIIQNPQSQAEFEGGTVTFTVAAGGSLPLGYQWRFNGADLPGQNGTSLMLSGITGANEGLYDVVVTNHAGVAVSDTAYLTVLYQYVVTASAGPNGMVSPAGPNIYLAGSGATFTATPGLNHRVDRWFLDGVPVQPGGGTYALLNIQAAHSVYVNFVTIDPCQGFAVNFAAGADTLAPSEIAGVLPQDGWLNAVGPTGTLTLSNGATVQWTAAETFAMPPLPLSPDFTLMQGGIDSPNATATVSVSGLSFGSMYDVYVYCAGANDGSGQTRVGHYTLNGGTARFALDPPASPDFDGNYLEATSTTGGAGASNGNYVVFYGVTGTSFSLTAQGDFSSSGELRAPINALQIFPRSFSTTSPLSLTISRQTNLPARVHIGGPAGYPVSVESSPDLVAWTPVAELMNTNGTVTYDDPDAPGNSQMFYRAVYAGFPSGPDNMAFMGSAPGVAGSSAMLALRGDVSRPEFAWQSTDPQLGPINTGFINASNWTLVPGNAACAPRIIFRAIIDCTNFSGSILFGTNGTVTVDVRCIFSNIVRQVRYILDCPIDFDIDSDNNNGLVAPDRTAYEDSIEDNPNKPGKVLGVNNGDKDGDTVPDLADGFNADNTPNTADDAPPNVNFVRVVLELPALIHPNIAQVRFSYSASDPALLVVTNAPTNTTYLLPPGHLRLWKKDGNVFRDKRGLPAGGDFIPAGTQIPATALGFSAAARTQTFFLEGIAPGTRPGDQRIVASVDPGDGLITALCSDAVRATAVRANLSTPNVRDNEKIKRGAVLCLNNDNDDFGAVAPFNFEPDNTQNSVAGENDLAALTLGMDFSGLTVGWVRLELAGDAAKLWRQPIKNQLLLSPGGLRAANAMPGTFAQFAGPLYIEGFARSAAVKDTELKLTYRLNANDPLPLCESILKLTVVELMLDADLNGALANDNPRYEPGYGFPGAANAGMPVITSANLEQRLSLIAVPLSADIVDVVRFTLNNTTTFPGYAMNQGTVSGPDFSLASAVSLLQKDVNGFANTRATNDLYCRDYGGSTIARVALIRSNNTVLATCEVRIPLDTDRDQLPDFYENANLNDPVRARQIFDPGDPMTKNVPAAGAAAAIPPMASALWEQETQNPVPTGAPANGFLGDGLIAFEEYRGFFHGDHANMNHRHHRTSPLVKDLFGFSNITDLDAAATDIGFGFLLDPNGGASAASPQVRVHRIDSTEWRGGMTANGVFFAARDINFNLAGIAGATRQTALFLDMTPRPGFGDLGVARPHINTGPNGVCNTLVPNAANVALRRDFQIIPRNQGLPNQPALRPGANGIIEPRVEAGDRLDFTFNPPRIVSATPDGALHTLTLPAGVNARGYAPDDQVHGNIRGQNGILGHATVIAMSATDVLRGEIREGADNKLEAATVLNASINDSLTNVVIDPNGNGLQTVIDPRDLTNANGTVSGGQVNGGFFTTNLAGNDIFRGRILEGGDNALDSQPANANDVVAGTIEEGADNKLASRPAMAADKLIGFVEDGGNGFLDPTINNAGANIDGSGGIAAPNDDIYDQATRTVTTGPDGIRNTNPQPGADDEQFIAAAGQGTPFALCVDPDDQDGADETGPPPAGTDNDDRVETAPGGDDVGSSSPGVNSDVNDSGYAHVPVPAFNQKFNPLQPAATAALPNRYVRIEIDCRLVPGAPAAANAARTANRQLFLKRTTGHEAGHCMHLEHYNNAEAAAPAPPGGRLITGALGHAIGGSLMIQTRTTTWPISQNFDMVDQEQIRLHQKHP